MVSSQVDVDRADYFNRDANAFGFSYGRLDLDLLLNYSSLEEVDGKLEIVFSDKIESMLSSFLVGRFNNYCYIYENKEEIMTLHDIVVLYNFSMFILDFSKSIN